MAPAPRSETDGDAKRAGSRDNTSNGNASSHPPPTSSSVGDNLAQALKDLARGEQTAAALEANLTNLEGKLDEILASFGMSAEDLDEPVEEQQVNKRDGDGKGSVDEKTGES